MKNTLHKGSVRTIIFKEEDTWFAVGLEFNLVVEGDTAEVAAFNLDEAISGYVESLRKTSIGGLRVDSILNQAVNPEYEELWNILESNKPIPSPFSAIHSFGRTLLNA